MNLGSLRGPRSILVHTLLLVMGVVVAVALASMALILLRPPPNNPPVTAYEVARLLAGKPITDKVEIETLAVRRAPTAASGAGEILVEQAIAGFLGAKPGDVRFLRPPPSQTLGGRIEALMARRYIERFERAMRQDHALYASDGQFNPRIFGPFTAAARQPDGRWLTVRRDSGDPLQRWQSATVLWILVSVLLAFPFAWLFSRRIARPTRAFAETADKIGRNERVEPIRLEGPKEIRLAAGALNDMQARLQRYVNERTSVVGAIAHDLRTPLSRLNFHLESAPDLVRQKAAAEIQEMEAMIAATLDFVQNEGRLQPSEPIDLSLLVEGVIDDLADLGHDAKLIKGSDVVVRGDAVLLKRLFANLVLNAVAYGSRARVSIRLIGKQAVIDVDDQGPGISDQDLERVFEPFYRGEGSRNRSTGGIGLGLAIVQSAARAHGGEIELTNLPSGGLRARVTLPVGD